MNGYPKSPRQLLGEGHRDFVHALRFEGMDRDQNHGSPAQHRGELFHSPVTDRISVNRRPVLASRLEPFNSLL